MADFDPVTTAQQLATAYTQPMQDQITRGNQDAQQTASALTSLQSALSTFDTALSGLSSSKGLRQFSANFSGASGATATASATAQAGTYSFYVEQLASANQIVYEDLPAVPVALGGPLSVNLADGSSFNLNLVAADTDSDGTISQSEIARAINQADGNAGKVTASVVTVGGDTKLLLSAGSTGASTAITLDTSALPAGSLKDALDGGRELVAAKDAVVWLGGQGGVRLQQASNTLTAIEGVSVTFTRAMSPTEDPATLTVASDDAGTAGNVQKFVDAYNALTKAIGTLTTIGNPDAGTGSAAFATDPSVRALTSRLNTMIRQSFGGHSLMDLGVKADRDGVLSLDKDRLNKTLTADPTALDDIFGKVSLTAGTGLLGSLDQYMNSWLKSGTGQIATRQATVQAMQKSLTDRKTTLDDQYQSAYNRYLQQFSQLQALQSQMSQTSGLFANIGSTS
ncbi:MAG TPA: flagellar filament capping protein FliD [Steroidobacteraceae bacterium]